MTIRTCALFLSLFSLAFSGTGQTTSLPKFIQTSQNRLLFSDDSSSFLPLFLKMDAIAKNEHRTVRIVHIGGSHVQGGVWSHAFLSAFQTKFLTAGGGFFTFPYRMGKTNGPAEFRTYQDGKWKLCRSVGKGYCQPLGMSALSVSTNDSAGRFGIALSRKAACRFVNSVKVYHNFNSSFALACTLGDSLQTSRTDLPDSGFTRFTFNAPVDSLAFQVTRLDTLQKDFVLFGFSLENNLAAGFYLAGLGANGASTSSFLRCSALAPQLATLQADLVILSLGVNDSQSKGFSRESFSAAYDSLIHLVRQVAPGAAIVLTTTTDNYIRRKTSNKRTIVAREVSLDLMKRHKVAVWDMFTIMGGYRSMAKWYAAGLASRDKVHFNNRGYTIVGNLMFDAINKAYVNHPR